MRAVPAVPATYIEMCTKLPLTLLHIRCKWYTPKCLPEVSPQPLVHSPLIPYSSKQYVFAVHIQEDFESFYGQKKKKNKSFYTSSEEEEEEDSDEEEGSSEFYSEEDGESVCM